MSDTKPKGPASYFPSIEQKHMQLVEWLKSEHGMGHGHANALVVHHMKGGA